MADERRPAAYRLDQVSIRITRQPGIPNLPVQRVTLSGTKNVVTVLNDLYKIRFFDLPADYTAKYSVFLKDDGTIQMQVLKMQDAASTKVCVSLGAYEKCITYGPDGPQELEALVKRVFAEAGPPRP